MELRKIAFEKSGWYGMNEDNAKMELYTYQGDQELRLA